MTVLIVAGGLLVFAVLVTGGVLLGERLRGRTAHRAPAVPPAVPPAVEPPTSPHGYPALPPVAPEERRANAGPPPGVPERRQADLGPAGRHRRDEAHTGSISATAIMRRIRASEDELPSLPRATRAQLRAGR